MIRIMMKLLYIPLAAVLLLAFSEAGAQNKIVRDIKPFDRVKVMDNVKVVFREGPTENLSFTAVGVGTEKVVTENNGRQLVIRMKPGFHKEAKVDVEVSYKKIRSIEVWNGAKVEMPDTIRIDDIELSVSGNSTLQLNVNTNTLKATLSSSGRVDIGGKAEIQEVDVNTNAQYLAYELETVNGYVKVSTGAEGVVWATKYLDAAASSKGELKYRGSPEDVKSGTSLGGKIIGNIEQ